MSIIDLSSEEYDFESSQFSMSCPVDLENDIKSEKDFIYSCQSLEGIEFEGDFQMQYILHPKLAPESKTMTYSLKIFTDAVTFQSQEENNDKEEESDRIYGIFQINRNTYIKPQFEQNIKGKFYLKSLQIFDSGSQAYVVIDSKVNFQLLNEIYGYLKGRVYQKGFQDRYNLISKIGQGASAIVYDAVCIQEGQNYAAKVFKKQKFEEDLEQQNSFSIQALECEIEILRKMKHKNIIGLSEVYESDSHIYIVQEKANGGTLQDKIVQNKGQFQLEEIKAIMQNLFDGLKYIHQKRIIHRDLKPENILLSDDLNCLIADFGLATKIEEQQKLLYRCGTPGYAAPEVYRSTKNSSYYDEKCDIFSMGVIFHVLLLGFSPYEKDKNSQNSVIKANLLNDIDYKEAPYTLLPKNYLELLKRMLNSNPVKRPTCQQALESPVFQNPLSCLENKQYELIQLFKQNPFSIINNNNNDNDNSNINRKRRVSEIDDEFDQNDSQEQPVKQLKICSYRYVQSRKSVSKSQMCLEYIRLFKQEKKRSFCSFTDFY